MSVATNSRRNGHDTTHRGIGLDEAVCPLCEQPIESHDRLIELQVIEQERFAEIETRVRVQVGNERDAEIARVQQQGLAAVDAAQRAAVKRETVIRRQAQATAAAALAPRLAKAEEGRKAVERQIKLLRTSQETVIAERLAAQRETLEKAIGDAVLAERGKWATEKLGMESQLQDMQRRLQARTAHQLGEPGEVDLYERLAVAFPDDRVSRVVKGVAGCDVLVEVIRNGDVVGKIALDSKVHARWSNKFTSKLRSDQLTENADYAILSSNVFPAGEQQLAIRDKVLIADPARVPVLVNLLRAQIVESHTLRLTAEARDAKAEKLLAFIISPGCRDLLDRIVKLTTDMAALDLRETDVHATTWKKRADLIRGVVDIHGQFSAAVSAIISGDRS